MGALKLIDNKNRGLGPAKRPSHGTSKDNKLRDGHSLSAYSNKLVSNNICDICGGDHNVLLIGLENVSHIITRPFPKEVTKANATNDRRRATTLDLVDIFWR